MLGHLRVVNLGVLQDASMEPSPGFTVVTGETGAGKTLLLGGLRLILGGSTDANAVGPFADTSHAEGLFVEETAELGASRVVPSEGRSRAYLEGSIVSAATLGERLGSLVEIVGQHDQLAITRRAHLLDLLDGSLGSDREERTRYSAAWDALGDALKRQELLGGDEVELTRELDLARYQASEISAAGLEPGLDATLEVEVSRLRNVEEIQENLRETRHLTDQMAEMAGELVARLRKVAGLDATAEELSGAADGLAASVADISSELRQQAEQLQADPALLEEIEDRLTAIGELKRKYGKTIAEVIDFGDRTAARVVELEDLIADADRIDRFVAEARASVAEQAKVLHRARLKAAEGVTNRMRVHLDDLGLGGAIVLLQLIETEPGPKGGDRVDLLFATDDRFDPVPVSDVASGGELSRLVLALRLATSSASTSTMVFDEVDTGIGGTTALAMGRKLAELAQSGQVLCVTHLPQVAAHADAHFVVERVDGVARVRRVTDDQRVTEIARMLAGQPDSDAGRTAAAELLASATD